MTDAELEVGFKLAYCLHPDALVAEYIIAEAWRGLEQYPKILVKRRVARERISEKRRQQTAPELGQAGEPAMLASDRQSQQSEPETQSTKRILPEACRFQYTVYSVSARWERDQEGPQRLPPRYSPTRDDCLVRYVKFLIWKTTDQARFHYVVGGLGCLLYTYSPQEIGTVASHFWGEPIDVARIVDGYRFNEKVHGQIKERVGKGIRGWVIERFQSTGLELDGPGAIGTRGPHDHETALVEHACEVCTPWGSSDVDPPPQAPPEASPEGAWTAWYQQRVAWAQAWSDWQRVHALIHPACGGVPQLIHTYNAETATMPSERLPDPQDKLRIPRFHSRIQPPNPGAPDRFVPPSFTPEGARRIRTLYERLRSRVTAGRFRLLRVYVDGEERQQFGPALGVCAPFSIPLEASCIEVVGEDAEGELSLALFLLSELDNDAQECQLWVRLEGGQTLTLQVGPVVQAETGEVTAYRLQVAYKEALPHSPLAWRRRVWASLQGAAGVHVTQPVRGLGWRLRWAFRRLVVPVMTVLLEALLATVRALGQLRAPRVRQLPRALRRTGTAVVTLATQPPVRRYATVAVLVALASFSAWQWHDNRQLQHASRQLQQENHQLQSRLAMQQQVNSQLQRTLEARNAAEAALQELVTSARRQTVEQARARAAGLLERPALGTFKTLVALGSVFLYNEAFDDAVAMFERAQRLDPSNDEPYKALAAIAKIQGRHETSVAHLTALLQRRPQDQDAWVYLGWSYYAMGETQKAREAYEHALKIAESADATFNLALAYQWQGDTSTYQALLARARGLAERDIAQHPQFAKAYFQLAKMAAHEKHENQAAAYLEEAVSLDTEWSFWMRYEPFFADVLAARPALQQAIAEMAAQYINTKSQQTLATPG